MTRPFLLVRCLALLLALPAVAQVGSLPPSRLGASALDLRELRLPGLDRARLSAEDVERAAAGQPARFAVPREVRVTPSSHGTWDTPAAGVARWRVRVSAAGASSLNFHFRRFVLPADGQLRIFAAEGRRSLRPFTAADAGAGGELWTPILLGDEATLELTVPEARRAEAELELATVNQGYRGFGAAVDKSGSCNVDVACPEANPWRDEVRSVAVYSINGTLLCTGAMIHNTARDFRPLFLTANHCGVNPANAGSVVVYWNYQNSTCRPPGGVASGQTGDGTFDQFQTGTTYLASAKTPDFTLLELNRMPAPEWQVFWAGWDRRAPAPVAAFTVHHPATDEKRISFDHDPLAVSSYANGVSPGDGSHLRVVDWDLGTTEPGSSGAPLFDLAGRIVGQLHGGFAACGNELSDWYGRLAISWEGDGTPSTRLRDWLDPLGAGSETLSGAAPITRCTSEEGALCLRQGRFQVTARWMRTNGTSGDGTGEGLTDDTGYFFFFRPENVEVVVKVLDGCNRNGHFWVFAGGLTNVETEIAVTDTASGQTRVYQNPQATPFQPVQDTMAFACL